MQIVLMRHGRPQLDLDDLRGQRIAPLEIKQILLDYEQADLASDSFPSLEAVEIAKGCASHFSSHLPRAVSSVERLGLPHEVTCRSVFAETTMPHTMWPRPKLDAFIWSVAFRLAWLVGFSQNGEAFDRAKQRAIDAADLVENAAKTHGDSFLLGHGIMNRVIGMELKRRKWNKAFSNGSQYWSYVVFEK